MAGHRMQELPDDQREKFRGMIYHFPWNEITNLQLEGLAIKLQKLQYAGNTTQRIMGSVRQVMKKCTKLEPDEPYYMAYEQYHRVIDLDVRIKQTGGDAGRRLPGHELVSLFDACRFRFKEGSRTREVKLLREHNANRVRDRAILGLLFLRGMGVEEIVNLNLKDYLHSTNQLDITKSKTPAGVRKVPMGGKAQTYLEEWITLRGRKDGRIFQRILKTGVIMPTGSHKSLRPHSIRWMLDKRCDIAGIARCTTHDGRRSFVTNMLESGMAPKVIQGIVGHANVEQTLKYQRYANTERTVVMAMFDEIQDRMLEGEDVDLTKMPRL